MKRPEAADRPPVDVRDADASADPNTTGETIQTLLIAEIRGFTAFRRGRGDETPARPATRFAEIVREHVEARAASIVEVRGDEVLAAFRSPRQAIRAAIELQGRFLEESRATPDLPLPVGIGLDVGEAVAVHGGYRGGALNLAARLCAEAGPGEILASRSVVRLAGTLEDVSFVGRGPVQLKGLTDPIEIHAIAPEGLDIAERMRAIAPVRTERRVLPGRLEFRVLGPLEVDARTGPIALGAPKQRAVLGHLLIRANELVPTETLIDQVWGEEPPENARNIIQIHISRLRKALGHDRIDGHPPGYRLRLDASELDATRFASLVREAKKSMPIDPSLAVVTLDDALALWRGPALADLAVQPSLRPEAARLDELRIEAQEDRVRALLASGASARAIGDLETLVARHPWRETLWGQLMLAFYREGRQADAIAAFQRARQILADDLGIDPSPELGRLHERILRQDEELDLRGEPLRGYRLLEKIGDGPTGVVFRAIQPHVHRDVAVKILDERIASDAEFARRFEPEGRAVAALEHPHIAPIYDHWREPGRAYIASRYLRGGSLRSMHERGDVLDQTRGLRILEQVATALGFAHEQGIAHGNVTESNVLFDEAGNAYVADFAVGTGTDAEPADDVHALATIARRLVSEDVPAMLSYLLSRAGAATDAPTARSIADAVRGVLEPHAETAPPATDVRNPYKGLRPFAESDARDFFGRSALVARLVSMMSAGARGPRFLAIVGPSGSGKSSVVHAGVIPAIRDGAIGKEEAQLVTEMVPGAHPIEELEAALLRVAVRPPGRLYERLAGGSRGLLGTVDLVAPADGSQVVLVIDQFEELFTLTADEHERDRFLEALRVAVSDPEGRLCVIVTLRADFYDRPLLYPRFGELFAARTEALPPLTPDELELAIRAPAEGVGVSPEPGFVAGIIADVAHQPGALPLLQYSLTELFERRDGDRLTLEAYRSVGGIAGALSSSADRIHLEMDEEGRRAIQQVFLRLVTLGEGTPDTRKRVARSELDQLDVGRDSIETVLDAFGRNRILMFDREPSTREPTVEIAHEALFTAWGRLRSWIDEAREDLRQDRRLARAAAEWLAAERDPSFLMRGARLEQVEAWSGATDLALGRPQRAYLKASVDHRDRDRDADRERREREARIERRSRTRLGTLVAVLAIASLVAGSLTIVATDQSRRAGREAERAELQAAIASARELAAAAVANLDADPELSVLLALESIEQTRAANGTVLPEAEEALHRAVTTSRVVLTTHGIGGTVAWSERGVFVTEGRQGTGMIDLRDAETGASALPAFRGHDADVTDVAFSSDGSMLASTGDDGALRVWDPATGDLIASASERGSAKAPSFDGDGSLVAAVWELSTVSVVDVATGDVVLRLRQPSSVTSDDYPLADAALSHDGQRIAVVDGDGGVTIVDVPTGHRSVRLDGAELVHALAWSPDDRSIATVGGSGVIEIWDAITGRIRLVLRGQRSFVWAVAWAPDASRIVTGGGEGAVQIWEVGDHEGRELFSLTSLEMSDGIGGVAFSPDGRRVMAGAIDRSAVKVWDVGPTGDAEWANLPAPASFGDATFMPDGNRIAVTSGWASATIWGLDPVRKGPTVGIPGDAEDRPPPALEASPDGHSIAIEREAIVVDGTVTRPAVIAVYDTRTGEALFKTRRQGPVGPVWSSDGTLIAMSGPRGSVSILDRSGREVTVLREEDDDHRIVAAAFTPDGRWLATSVRLQGGEEPGGLLQVWDLQRGEIVREIEARYGDVVFDPTGDRVVTFNGKVAETWDIKTGTRVAEADTGSDGSVWGVAISPDASRIATSLPDGTIQLLDATDGTELMLLRGHTAAVPALSFSPDGARLVSVGFGLVADVVRVWALDSDDLISIALRNVTRELTDDECREYLHVVRCVN